MKIISCENDVNQRIFRGNVEVSVYNDSSFSYSSNFPNSKRIIMLRATNKDDKNDPVIVRFDRQSVTVRVTEKVPREEAAVKHIFLHIPQIME